MTKFQINDSIKFYVNQNSNALQQYLTKRSINMNTFVDLHVTGKMPPKEATSSLSDKTLPPLLPSDLRGQVS